MPTFTYLIAEDEALPRQDLIDLLVSLWPEASCIAVCENGIEAVAAYHEKKPDVAFLDIKMPGLSGLEVAKQILVNNPSCLIVFATAYEQHAVEAFDQHAADYLLKPVRRDRLQDTVARLKRQLSAVQSSTHTGGDNNKQSAEETLAKLIQTLQGVTPAFASTAQPAKSKLQWIHATVGDSVRMFPLADVVYFQSSDKYTRVVMHKEETVIRTPIKDLLETLDADEFWQIHRGTLVRASAIARANRDDFGRLQLQLRERKEFLAVSQAYVHLFKGI